MSFWEILFNVVAFLWSPLMISIVAFGLVLFLIAAAVDSHVQYHNAGPEVFFPSMGALVVAVLGAAFTIWWTQAGISGLGWHYVAYTPR